MLELSAKSACILLDGFSRVKHSLGSFSAWVSDESRSSADDYEGAMAASLEVSKAHNRNEISDVEAGRSRIEATVRGNGLLIECSSESVSLLVQQTSPFQLVKYR